MAMGALAAHKLRSALTLLGVLVGVFSIIVVMTAMRVMQSSIEAQLSQLGSQTFMIRKWPRVYFGGSNADFEKYWRRKNITLRAGETAAGKSRAAGEHRRGNRLLVGRNLDALQDQRADGAAVTAKLPAVFPRATGTCRKAGCCWMRTWTARAMFACWAACWPQIFSRTVRPWANGSRLTASITPSSACWNPRAARSAAIRIISPSCRSPPA